VPAQSKATTTVCSYQTNHLEQGRQPHFNNPANYPQDDAGNNKWQQVTVLFWNDADVNVPASRMSYEFSGMVQKPRKLA
jgi:hypothetical protein